MATRYVPTYAEIAAKLVKLHQGIKEIINDAKANCGGDGLGCEGYRDRYAYPAHMYKKCAHCPMETAVALLDLIDGEGQ